MAIKYNLEKHGVRLQRDCYADQFAEPNEIKFNYMVFINDECVDEGEDTKALARRIRKMAKRLDTIADGLDRLKPQWHIKAKTSKPEGE